MSGARTTDARGDAFRAGYDAALRGRPDGGVEHALERWREKRSVDVRPPTGDGEWIDYACRCCKAKPQHAWWKFCPYCGTDIPLDVQRKVPR